MAVWVGLLGLVPAVTRAQGAEAFTQTVMSEEQQEVTVHFHPVALRSENFLVLEQLANGEFAPLPPPPQQTYLGWVEDHPGAVAGGLRRADGSVLVGISFEDGRAWTSYGGPAWIQGNAEWTPAWPTTTMPEGGAGGRVYAVEVGLDLPYRLMVAAGGTVTQVVEMAEFSVLMTNVVYLRDAALEHHLGRVVVRAVAAQDPYETAGTSTNLLLDRVRAFWNGPGPWGNTHQLAMVATPGGGAGLAYVGVVGTNAGYSSNHSDVDGNFSGVWRHEVGHNWGANHFEGGGQPEGPTIMSGNALARFSSSELAAIKAHRDTRLETLADLGPYPLPLPPRANQDRVTLALGEPAVFDVLANDSDSNGLGLTILSTDGETNRGGTVERVAGGGRDGQDRLRYVAPTGVRLRDDFFRYRIANAEGRTATGVVVLRPTFRERLWAHWPLDEAGGQTAREASSAQKTGTLSGGATLGMSGLQGTALSLDGTGVVVTAPMDRTTEQVTMTGWIRRTGPQPDFAGIVFARDGSGEGMGLNFRGDTNELGFHWPTTDGTAAWSVATGLLVPDGTWAFFALAVAPTYVEVSLQGKGGALQTFRADLGTAPARFDLAMHLGGDPNFTNRRMIGQLQDVRVFGWALSGGEMAALAAGAGTVFDPQPAVDSRPVHGTGQELAWTARAGASSFHIYRGTDYAAVRDATPASPEFLDASFSSTLFVSDAGAPGRWFWRVDAGVDGVFLPGPVWHYLWEPGVHAVADGAWHEPTTWNHGLGAPQQGVQGEGEHFQVTDQTVTTPEPAVDAHMLIGERVTIRQNGVLDLARLHAMTLQAATYDLPPLTLETGGTLRFRASVGSSSHRVLAPLAVAGSGTIEVTGGSYENFATLEGKISGTGRLRVVSNHDAGGIPDDRRRVVVSAADNSYAGDWLVEHRADGDDWAGLVAAAPGALGTGQVEIGRRAILEAAVPEALDTLGGITLTGALAELRLTAPLNQPLLPITLASGSPVVTLGPGEHRMGSLAGPQGRLQATAGAALLEVFQTTPASFGGDWSADLRLVKNGPEPLTLAGDTAALAVTVAQGALVLAPGGRQLESLDLVGGDLELTLTEPGVPALEVSGDVEGANRQIRIHLPESAEQGTIWTTLTYGGQWKGTYDIQAFRHDGSPQRIEVDQGTGLDSRLAITVSNQLSFAAWSDALGLPAERAGLLDRHGPRQWTNLQAYAMGLDPRAVTAADEPQVILSAEDPGAFEVRLSRSLLAEGIEVELYQSADLVTWVPASPYDFRTAAIDDEREWHSYWVVVPAAGRAFIQVRFVIVSAE